MRVERPAGRGAARRLAIGIASRARLFSRSTEMARAWCLAVTQPKMLLLSHPSNSCSNSTRTSSLFPRDTSSLARLNNQPSIERELAARQFLALNSLLSYFFLASTFHHISSISFPIQNLSLFGNSYFSSSCDDDDDDDDDGGGALGSVRGFLWLT